MILKQLELNNFRLFSNIDIYFDEGINIITGMNGNGKTSILESIYYLALTKSFRTTNDKNVVTHKNKFFDVTGNFIPDHTENKKIRVFFSEEEGKHLFIDNNKIARFSEYVGTIPCVVLTLNDLKLTLGGPTERRRFLDVLLSQMNPVYLESLKIYKRTLLQKNALLMTDDKGLIENQMEVWNRQLVEHGTQIVLKRLQAVDFFNENLTESYSNFSPNYEKITATYKSTICENIENRNSERLSDSYRNKLKMIFKYERDKKTSMVGPHRDDIEFQKDSKSFKEFCSQGENKSLIIALKFLEWEYVSKNRKVNPLLLLDDIFGELDEHRMTGLVKFLKNTGQTFITTTLEDKFDKNLIARRLMVSNKKVYDA